MKAAAAGTPPLQTRSEAARLPAGQNSNLVLSPDSTDISGPDGGVISGPDGGAILGQAAS